jgi:acetamidase/formamidase
MELPHSHPPDPVRTRGYFQVLGVWGGGETLTDGRPVVVECPDCTGLFSDKSPAPQGTLDGFTRDVVPANPLAGPFTLPLASPGDALAIRILDVQLDSTHGITLLAPNHGLLTAPQASGSADEAPPERLYEWQLDRDRGVARLENAIVTGSGATLAVPLRPMVGCVAVAPPGGLQISTLYSGAFGGNLDLPLIAAGATVLLPVFVPGAHLFIGDIHAAQGHGEVVGGAIETSGKVHFDVKVIRHRPGRRPLAGPRIITPQAIASVAVNTDTRAACQEAFAALTGWVAEVLKRNRYDVLMFLSQVAWFQVGNMVNGSSVVAAGLNRDLLDHVTDTSDGGDSIWIGCD